MKRDLEIFKEPGESYIYVFIPTQVVEVPTGYDKDSPSLDFNKLVPGYIVLTCYLTKLGPYRIKPLPDSDWHIISFCVVESMSKYSSHLTALPGVTIKIREKHVKELFAHLPRIAAPPEIIQTLEIALKSMEWKH